MFRMFFLFIIRNKISFMYKISFTRMIFISQKVKANKIDFYIFKKNVIIKSSDSFFSSELLTLLSKMRIILKVVVLLFLNWQTVSIQSLGRKRNKTRI